MSFANKVVLVTGASSGIGAATAIAFAKDGANVAIVGRNDAKLQNVTDKIQAISCVKPLVLKLDVSKDDEVQEIIKSTIEKFGKLDILVNNAGIVRKGSILDGKILESYDETVKTNLRAVIHLTTLAAPYLVQTKGNIVNVSSIASKFIFDTNCSAYCVIKSALDQFTKAAAKELAPSGVRVNSVNPGPVKTDIFENARFDVSIDSFQPMTALNRLSDASEIADLIVYLAGEKAKGITGSIIVHDNGVLIK